MTCDGKYSSICPAIFPAFLYHPRLSSRHRSFYSVCRGKFHGVLHPWLLRNSARRPSLPIPTLYHPGQLSLCRIFHRPVFSFIRKPLPAEFLNKTLHPEKCFVYIIQRSSIAAPDISFTIFSKSRTGYYSNLFLGKESLSEFFGCH